MTITIAMIIKGDTLDINDKYLRGDSNTSEGNIDDNDNAYNGFTTKEKIMMMAIIMFIILISVNFMIGEDGIIMSLKIIVIIIAFVMMISILLKRGYNNSDNIINGKCINLIITIVNANNINYHNDSENIQ